MHLIGFHAYIEVTVARPINVLWNQYL